MLHPELIRLAVGALVLGATPGSSERLSTAYSNVPLLETPATVQQQPAKAKKNKDSDKDTDKKGRKAGKDKDKDTDKDTEDDTEKRRARGPAVCTDANGDGVCDDRTRRVDKCHDKDRDGFCDSDRRDKDDFCLDQDGDGRCDTGVYPVRTPRTLPQMIPVATIREGNRTADVNRWLGGARVRVRYVDANGNGVPERVTFVNLNGDVVQVWNDTNGDGRADAVQIWRKGKQLREITG